MEMDQKRKTFGFGRYRPVLILFIAKTRLANCFSPVVSKFIGKGQRYPQSKTQLSGIRGFRQWFENEFPDSVVTIDENFSEDTFDHVLLDMNHMIHKVLRRSRSEEHAVRSLMMELDSVLKMVIPTKSLVLAIDGAPPAAKLATQRSRRYGTLVRTQWKLDHFDKLRISKKHRARKLRAYNSEIQSLQITPGTEFQESMEKTLLYWAWQRLQYQRGKLRDVRIYISPSTVPGEGEVKLLEWILQKPRQGQSVAILGGDSDLLLEGLIIPPYWTHNIFVIQADTGRKYYSVSLWETTRKLHSWLPSGAPPEQILQLRTDLVILVLLNGNDYLPRLQGTRGFSNLCQIYKRLVREEYSDTDRRNSKSRDTVGLVNPDTLEFRIDFCLRFFDEVSKTIKPRMQVPSTWGEDSTDRKMTPLATLNNLVAAGFFPRPSRFQVIYNDQPSSEAIDTGTDEDDDEEEEDYDDQDMDDGTTVDEMDARESGVSPSEILVRLTLGIPDSDDFFQYEMTHDANKAFKLAKNKLASMALDDLFGTDLASSDSEEDYDALADLVGSSSRGYSWEVVNTARPGRVDKYLAGLLWTIKTYQDGICADYNYSYGRLQSPDVSGIIDYFEKIKFEGGSVGIRTLLGDSFSPPVSAGLSCLAALPAQVKHLVPEPYRWILDDKVEEFYAECMDREDNGFDMKRFEALCEGEIQRLREIRGESDSDDEQLDVDSSRPTHGRRILSGDHWWTVLGRTPEPLAHPFDPPQPPVEEFAPLTPNPRIRVSRSFSIDAPRSRAVWGNNTRTKTQQGKPKHRKDDGDFDHLSFGKLLARGKGKGSDNGNLLDVQYKIDYPKERQKRSRKKKIDKLADKVPPGEIPDIMGRMQEFQKVMPPSTPVANVEGLTALYILSQLHALDMVGPIEFNMTLPSQSAYAAWNPEKYEHYQLQIKPSEVESSNVLNRTLEFEQDRDVHGQSRQGLKQHLADLALSDLVGPGIEWKSLTFADLRYELNQRIISNSINGRKGDKIDGCGGSLPGNIHGSMPISRNTSASAKTFQDDSNE